jgi:hypothetical protein
MISTAEIADLLQPVWFAHVRFRWKCSVTCHNGIAPRHIHPWIPVSHVVWVFFVLKHRNWWLRALNIRNMLQSLTTHRNSKKSRHSWNRIYFGHLITSFFSHGKLSNAWANAMVSYRNRSYSADFDWCSHIWVSLRRLFLLESWLDTSDTWRVCHTDLPRSGRNKSDILYKLWIL